MVRCFRKILSQRWLRDFTTRFSGCGDSADDVIRLENQIEDLKAACGWLAERGFERIILHADGSGALVALRAVPDKVQALVLTAPILGPAEVSWEDVFSPSQLAELEKVGHTRIPNDQGLREHIL